MSLRSTPASACVLPSRTNGLEIRSANFGIYERGFLATRLERLYDEPRPRPTLLTYFTNYWDRRLGCRNHYQFYFEP